MKSWHWLLVKMGLTVLYGFIVVPLLDLFLDGWEVVAIATLVGWLALMALDDWRDRRDDRRRPDRR